MKLHLAEGLSLPVDVVTQTIAVLAKRRAGKSYAMRRLVEQLFGAGQQVVLVDPKGDQWGIRSAADGKSPGLPIVILGGERADVPLEASSGEVVAKLVVEERVSVLLDLSLFRKHEVATFMTGFLENLYRLKAREIYRTPLMLVIDEADAIAPQKPQRGEERMLGAAEDIVRRGGQRGLGCVLVTQRSAVLNKNVLTQSQILLALRTIAPQDLAAMNAWIDVHGTEEQKRTLMASLPSLPVGDAWIWSPGWPTVDGIFKRVHVLPIDTFDSGATPRPGEKRTEPKTVADVDLDALKRQMSATIEKAKADDPKELRRQLAEKDRQLRELKLANERHAAIKPAPAAAPEIRTAEVPMFRSDEFVRFEEASARALEAASELREAHSAVARNLDDARQLQATAARMLSAKLAPSQGLRPVQTSAKTASRPAPRHVAPPAGGSITGPMQRILDGLAELEALGLATPPRIQAALFAGYSHVNSTGFVKALGALRVGGWVDYGAGGVVVLTDAGRAAATFAGDPSTLAERQERIRAMLKPVEQRVLGPLVTAYPDALPREELAVASGYGHVNSTGFVKAVGRLRTLGLIDYPDRGRIVATDVLFLEGR